MDKKFQDADKALSKTKTFRANYWLVGLIAVTVFAVGVICGATL